MSTVVIPATCTCGTVLGIDQAKPRQCPDHFRLWRGDTRLASVGSIIRAVFPQGPKPPEDVLENARERGSEVNMLFDLYVLGQLKKIPAGIRHDARDLFLKLKGWFDRQNFRSVEVQVVLGDDDHGGVLDYKFDGVPTELKATYSVDPTHIMQAAGYACLNGSTGTILHVTARIQEPVWQPLVQKDYEDWQTMLAHYRMVKRRAPKVLNGTADVADFV